MLLACACGGVLLGMRLGMDVGCARDVARMLLVGCCVRLLLDGVSLWDAWCVGCGVVVVGCVWDVIASVGCP